jgi:hypothetical protein
MASTTPGISVQFDVQLAQLDAKLPQAISKIAAASKQIDAITKQSMSSMMDESVRMQDAAISKLGESIKNKWSFLGQGRGGSRSALRSARVEIMRSEMAGIAQEASAIEQAFQSKSVFGTGAMERFGETGANGMASSLQRKLASGAAKFALVGAADAVLRGVADAIRENKGAGGMAESIAESLHNGLKNLPLVGAFSELGEAIGNKMGDGIAAGIVTQATGLGHKIDEKGGLTIADIRGRSRSLEISRMGSFDGEAAKFNDEMSRLELENKDNPSVLKEIRSYREKFNADLKSRISESVNAKEVAKYREDEADWKAGQEFKRQQQAARDQEAVTLKRGQISAVVGERQSKLELIRDMMQGVSRASAEDFITTAQTAAGSFRTGQRDASRIVADNTKMLVDLQRQENDIVEEIRDHVAELQLLK